MVRCGSTRQGCWLLFLCDFCFARGALQELPSFLRIFDQHVGRAARIADPVNGLVPGCKITFRIPGAAVEGPLAFRLSLDPLPLCAFWTLDAGSDGFRVQNAQRAR